MTEARSIQELLYPTSTCFGCGPANPNGLQLRSYLVEDAVEATYLPGPTLSNGMNTLNGGVIATLLDCHSGAAVFQASAVDGVITEMWVTTELEIRYRLPVPLEQPITLRARIVEREGDVMAVDATMAVDGKTRVQAHTRWTRVRGSGN
jgi:acyl-coenzyme A thioesterase PaaI-like protein